MLNRLFLVVIVVTIFSTSLGTITYPVQILADKADKIRDKIILHNKALIELGQETLQVTNAVNTEAFYVTLPFGEYVYLPNKETGQREACAILGNISDHEILQRAQWSDLTLHTDVAWCLERAKGEQLFHLKQGTFYLLPVAGSGRWRRISLPNYDQNLVILCGGIAYPYTALESLDGLLPSPADGDPEY